MNETGWQIHRGEGPLVAAANHSGNAVRSEVADWLALADLDRLREEDPFTDHWTAIAPTRIVGTRSRFEVDFNRPRAKAVYVAPEDAWGLRVWRDTPPASLVEESLAIYDAFYNDVQRLLDELVRQHGRVVVFDLHTYNHRRRGPEQQAEDPESNPEVNVGTGSLDRRRWASLIDRFMSDLAEFDFAGRQLDVRENVRFRGGHFPQWIHQQFPDTVCVLAIEVKKFFMDEWTGAPDDLLRETVHEALRSTVKGVLEELDAL